MCETVAVCLIAQNPARARRESNRRYSHGFSHIIQANSRLLQSLAQDHNVHDLMKLGDANPWSRCVVALILLVPRTCYRGPLTVWDQDERFLWSLLQFTPTAFSCIVTESWRALQPKRGHVSADAVAGCVRGSMVDSLLPRSASEILSDTFESQGIVRTGLEVLETWKVQRSRTLPTLSLPVPLALAIASGTWQRVMLPWASIPGQRSLFQTFPSSEITEAWRAMKKRCQTQPEQ